MKIPKYIISNIKDIENLTKKLSNKERELYNWLEKNTLDFEYYNENNEDNLDMYLHQLFTFGDGSSLINKIQSIERK